MALPQLATPDDIKKLVRFLQRKPAGVTKSEGERTLSTAAFDSRKIGALQRLGVVVRDGDKIKLSPECGRSLARLSDEEFPIGMRELIRGIPAYLSCLEWAFENNIEVLSVAEVGAQWHDHHSNELGTDNESEISRRATCFLQLCGGADLGEFTEGRRGQPSRLRINREAVESFVYQSQFESTESDNWRMSMSSNGDEEIERKDASTVELNGQSKATQDSILGQAIFVGHGRSKVALSQLKAILEKFKIPYHIAQDEPHLGRPISEKVRETMRACNCAILIFTADEEFRTVQGDTVWRPSENVIHELGASSYLYGHRIVILKEDVVKLPSNFSDLGYISFSKDELNAKSMDVLSELIGFGIVKVST